MKKKLPIIIVSFLLVAGLSFYGGMTYAASKNKRPVLGNFDRAGMGARAQGGRQVSGAFTNGEIISKDDQSITLKLRDGGSKIVLLSASTTVSKMTTGAVTDLASGLNVMVNGTSNSDGSMSAQTIQLSPNFVSSSTPR